MNLFRMLAGFAFGVICIGFEGDLAAQTVRSFGNFDVSFFNEGETIYWGNEGAIGRSATGIADWTEEQMQDIGWAIETYEKSITNVPSRRMTIQVIRDIESGIAITTNTYTLTISGSFSNSGIEAVWREQESFQSEFGFDKTILFPVNDYRGNYNFGEGAPDSDETDFRTTVLHELSHSLISPTSSRSTSSGGLFYLYQPTRFDLLLKDENGVTPGRGTTAANFDVESAMFYGENTMAIFGGPVPVDILNKHLEVGFDDSTSGLPEYAGEPISGSYLRDLGRLDRAILRDLGWSVVPEFLLGDCNVDGVVDFEDIPAFIATLINGEFQAEADCDQSGVVDFSDIPAFIAILQGS